MAEPHSGEGSSNSGDSAESLESTVKLNVKTLDSQIYSFHVDKSMLVSSFKEKIAQEVGVQVGQQRLIFRGKVLKDDHPLSEYHVENDDTFHLVVRQSQVGAGENSGEANGNNRNSGNDASAGGPRSRVGQISHSVVLGTFNVGEQGESVVPDLGRVIGAVLNSIGIGSQSTTAGFAQPNVQANAPGQASQGNETEGTAGNQVPAGNHSRGPDAIPVQIPLPGLTVPPLSSLQAPITNSLITLSEFMNRLELSFSPNGNPSLANISDIPRVELPSDARGLPTVEALSIVLRQAQRLLNDHVAGSLSHLAGRLENEGVETVPTIRGQIQAESLQLGLAMQHLGALFLELGRTILTLRLGHSSADSFINAGPAVYISPLGPNPIMVQPFPLQTGSFFGPTNSAPSNPGMLGPIGIGNAARNINIHIHAVGSRAGNGEGTPGEPVNGTAVSHSGTPLVVPVSNIVAAAVPSHSTGAAVSGATEPGVSTTRAPPGTNPLSHVVAAMNSLLRNRVDNIGGQSQASSGGTSRSTAHTANDIGIGQPSSAEDQKGNTECHEVSNTGEYMNSSDKETIPNSLNASEEVPSKNENSSMGNSGVPLGLGLGGLQPMRRSKLSKSQSHMGGEGPSGNTTNQNQQTAHRIMQSLASSVSTSSREDGNNEPSGQPPLSLDQITTSLPMGGQIPTGQVDAANIMSHVLQSPHIDSLLGGVTDLAGGSPDVLRNMMEQITQNPMMSNMLNQIVHQMHQMSSEEAGDMILDSMEDDGFDLSGVVQQMMPLMMRAINGGAASREQFSNVRPRAVAQDEHNSSGNDNAQIDLQRVTQEIIHCNPPVDIFRAMVETTHASSSETFPEDLMDELCSDEQLADEYVEMIKRDLNQRLHSSSSSAEKP